MAELTIESALAGELPDGFETTLSDEDRLRQLRDVDVASTLDDVVADYGNFQLTEREIVRAEVQRVINAFQTPERTLEFPGTALEFANVQRFASLYKVNADTPSGTIKDRRRANTDDIVFCFAGPEVYEEISGNTQDTFEVTGLTGGNTLEVIDDTGLPEAGQTPGNTLSLDDDEMLYFTGDFIDLADGKSVITKVEWADVDGESYGYDEALLPGRLSSTHIATAQGAWVKSTCDLDAKIYADGDAELVPIAFYMGPGNKAPVLV